MTPSYPGSPDYLQAMIVSKLSTGSPILDSLVGVLAVSSSQTITSLITDLKSGISSSIYSLLRLLVTVYRILRRRQIQTLVTRTLKIKYITDDREINLLYEDMVWYINSMSKYVSEDEVSIEVTKNRSDITSRLPKNRTSSFVFEDTTVNYSMHSEVITLYADREQKKENFIITLWADFPKTGSDLFSRLVETAKKLRAEAVSKKAWQQHSHRNVDGKWVSKELKSCRRIETVILKEGVRDSLVRDIDNFNLNQDWYVSRDVPYTRRYLFYGEPGSGKSSMIRALAYHLKRDIHYLILSDIKSDSELFSLFESIPHSKTILVIEDIDCASKIVKEREASPPPPPPPPSDAVPGDKKKVKKEGLTLAGLLNVLDGGMVDCHGQVAVLTTNHPDRLDPALIRPGRIDSRFEFTLCDRYQLEALYTNFFNTPPPSRIFSIDTEISPASVVSVFLRYKDQPELAWKEVVSSVSIHV